MSASNQTHLKTLERQEKIKIKSIASGAILPGFRLLFHAGLEQISENVYASIFSAVKWEYLTHRQEFGELHLKCWHVLNTMQVLLLH